MSIESTIEKVRATNPSVVRYGDGEIRMINNKNIIFQQSDRKLTNYLKNILISKEPNLLVCLPHTFSQLDRYVRRSRKPYCLGASSRRGLPESP